MPVDLSVWLSGLGGALIGGAATFIAALMSFSTSRQQIVQLREQSKLHKTQIDQSRQEFELFKDSRAQMSKARLIDLDDLLEDICEDLMEFAGQHDIDDSEIEVLSSRKALQEAGSIRGFLSECKISCDEATYDLVKSFMRMVIDLVDDCKSYSASMKEASERADILLSVVATLRNGELARQKLAPRVS